MNSLADFLYYVWQKTERRMFDVPPHQTLGPPCHWSSRDVNLHYIGIFSCEVWPAVSMCIRCSSWALLVMYLKYLSLKSLQIGEVRQMSVQRYYWGGVKNTPWRNPPSPLMTRVWPLTSPLFLSRDLGHVTQTFRALVPHLLDEDSSVQVTHLTLRYSED